MTPTGAIAILFFGGLATAISINLQYEIIWRAVRRGLAERDKELARERRDAAAPESGQSDVEPKRGYWAN